MMPVITSRMQREKNVERYIEKLISGHGIKFCESNGKARCICSSDAGRKVVRKWTMENENAFLIGAGRILAGFHVQLVVVSSI